MTISYEELVEIVRNAGTQIDLSKLNESAKFTDIGADSLDIMNILLGIQDKTGKEIPDDDIEKLASIKAIRSYLDDRA